MMAEQVTAATEIGGTHTFQESLVFSVRVRTGSGSVALRWMLRLYRSWDQIFSALVVALLVVMAVATTPATPTAVRMAGLLFCNTRSARRRFFVMRFGVFI